MTKNIQILLDSSKKAGLDKGAERIKCITVCQQLVPHIKERTQTEGVENCIKRNFIQLYSFTNIIMVSKPGMS
jgi:hypothetical protein